jgi:uncharacterized protein
MNSNYTENNYDLQNSRSIVKNQLIFAEKIIIKRSNIHRWGVFAKNDIKCGEIIEEFPYFLIPKSEMDMTTSIIEYSYRFRGDFIIGMGCCGLYNHSFDPNLDYCIDRANEIMTHYAIRDISSGEELTLDYGEENVENFINEN